MEEKIKIFVVEDEIIAAESLTCDLQQLGYEVVGKTTNAEKAIEKIKQLQPDLVLLDVKIGGSMDGIELAKELNKIFPIPIVYLTAYADNNTLQRAMKTSPYGYIVKPYKKQDLAATISIALQKYQEIRRIKTQLTVQQERLNFLSKYDEVTQLPNQLSLVENFNAILEVFYQQVEQNNPDQDIFPQIIPIFYITLTSLKLLRDNLGTEFTNFVLKAVVNRLKSIIIQDSVLVRIDDDDFAIISPPVTTKQVAIDFAEDFIKKMAPPFVVNQREIYVDLQMGISFYPLHGENIDELLYKAKEAIKDLAERGQNCYQVHSPVFHKHNFLRLKLESDLHHALEKNELEIHYQPLVEVKTNKIIGAEALLRWNHPKEKYISPEIFIPLAEDIGLIESINDWLLNNTCQQFHALRRQFSPQLRLFVNLSVRQLYDESLENKILKAITHNCFPSTGLVLEISEKALVKHTQQAAKKLKRLKSIGLSIAIDDFGTGYSSLGYLGNIDFELLKIDQCFVRNIDRNPRNQTITKYLIEMAHQLGIIVIAEGVEKEPELAFLYRNNCDYYQGYLFSRPLPYDEFEEFLTLHF
ncbi:MAG TPA: EAL domain-containing protein [Geminocystis sp. M7585_C2015_104]|nr:EAL domain-containing protein [Geminocystis sp. M7585_C2015_104]